MRRLINRLRVSRTLDDGGELPPALADDVAADEKLNAWHRQQQQLIEQLRADAPGWIRQNSASAPLLRRKPDSGPANWTRMIPLGVTLTACGLVSFMLAGANNAVVNPRPAPPEVAAELDVDDLRNALNRSQETVAAMSSRVNELRVAVRPSRIGAVTTEYVEQAGSVFGRGLAVLRGAR